MLFIFCSSTVAPELFSVTEVTSASDIWSIGCLIVELLSGCPPYFHLSQMEILYNLLEAKSIPLPDNISKVNIFILKFYINS